MNIRRVFSALAACVIGLSFAMPTQASLIFQLQRVSDTEAIMTATGSAGEPVSGLWWISLQLANVMSYTVVTLPV